jgi:hypothetical protein
MAVRPTKVMTQLAYGSVKQSTRQPVADPKRASCFGLGNCHKCNAANRAPSAREGPMPNCHTRLRAVPCCMGTRSGLFNRLASGPVALKR